VSGFNELFEAALKKERHSASGDPHDPPSGSRSSPKAKGKRRFGPEVEELKKLTKKLVMQGGMASPKWTWAVDLTVEDLRGLIQGADRYYLLPHSGYDQDLITGSLQSNISEWVDPDKLKDPMDPELLFTDLSMSITTIPELHPNDIPTYLDVQLLTDYDAADPEPDPVIDAFPKEPRPRLSRPTKW
jgi:hypothetical protein